MVRLQFECTKNTTRYEACIISLEGVLELKVKKLEVFMDSLLIIYQVKVYSHSPQSLLIDRRNPLRVFMVLEKPLDVTVPQFLV